MEELPRCLPCPPGMRGGTNGQGNGGGIGGVELRPRFHDRQLAQHRRATGQPAGQN